MNKEQETRVYPALMIAIPHQAPPKLYVADDENDFVDICYMLAKDNYQWPGHWETTCDGPDSEETWISEITFEDYVAAFAHDLAESLILYGKNHVTAWLENGERTGHQALLVNELVREKARELSWLNTTS